MCLKFDVNDATIFHKNRYVYIRNVIKESMNKSILFLLMGVTMMSLASCDSAPTIEGNKNSKIVEQKQKSEQVKKQPSTKTSTQLVDIPILTIISKENEEIPSTTVRVLHNEKSVEVVEASLCSKLKKEVYESYDIPTQAIEACHCWWAGAGSNFYIIEEDEKVNLYKREVFEEMAPEETSWVVVKTIP